MTRTITLKLADDTTATHCGICAHSGTYGVTHSCGAFGHILRTDRTGFLLRAKACIESENALIDLEIAAMRRGYGTLLAEGLTDLTKWKSSTVALNAAIAELEARKVKP